jgi:hypothetical protein
LSFSQSDPGVGHLNDHQSAARLDEPDLRIEDDAHTGEPADQGVAADDVVNGPLFTLQKRVDGATISVCCHVSFRSILLD